MVLVVCGMLRIFVPAVEELKTFQHTPHNQLASVTSEMLHNRACGLVSRPLPPALPV